MKLGREAPLLMPSGLILARLPRRVRFAGKLAQPVNIEGGAGVVRDAASVNSSFHDNFMTSARRLWQESL